MRARATPPPEYPSCTSSSQREAPISCTPAGTPRACGICRDPIRTCEADADCSAGSVCIEVSDPCSCRGLDTVCVGDCRIAEDACSAGERCEDDGRCLPVSCAEGLACPLNTRCGEGGSAPDAHGCVRLSCDDTSDCDCGVCIDGSCQDGPGACVPPVG